MALLELCWLAALQREAHVATYRIWVPGRQGGNYARPWRVSRECLHNTGWRDNLGRFVKLSRAAGLKHQLRLVARLYGAALHTVTSELDAEAASQGRYPS